MTDPWAERLSEYLDGELDAAESAELERHLNECESCRHSLLELRSVVARLRNDLLRPEDQPTLQAWRDVRQAIGGAPRQRWVGRAAIAAGIVGLSLAAGIWRQHLSAPPLEAPRVAPADYRQAAGDLETILRERRHELRPETIRAVEASLAAIDSAIAQAARALAADPANDYVTRYLAQLRDTKLTALRQAVALVHQRG